MSHPIIDKIVQQGVQAVNVSMLSPDLRKRLMTEAGHTLMRQGRFKEAAHAFSLGDNKEELREQGKWFLKQHKLGLAAYFLIHTEEEDALRQLAEACIAANEIDAAKEIYSSIGDETMLSFIRENL